MDTFVQQLINGLTIGSIYALIALGYTMVYGVLRLINFAHGDVFMVGAYAGLFTFERVAAAPDSASAWMVLAASIVMAMVVCSLLGLLIQRVAYQPLRKAP